MDERNRRENPFIPSFGELPYSLAGRRDETHHISRAFEASGRDPYLFTLLTGARGTGKTALLSYAAQEAEANGWIAVSTFAVPGMLEMLYESACDKAAHIVDISEGAHLTGITAGPVGASWERPVGEQASWHTRMSRLVSKLSERGTGVLFTLDEVDPELDEVIMLVSSCQIFVREGLRVALYIAGLPRATSQLISHQSVSFLRRAMQFRFGSVADYDAELALEKTILAAGKTIDADALAYAAKATGGYPFMIQLVGYRIWEWGEEHDGLTADDARRGVATAQREFDDRILAPSFYDLSNMDRAFLRAMLEDDGPSTLSDIAQRLGRGNSYAAQYKRRLLDQGVIEEGYDKGLSFALPGMREFISAQG